MLFFKITFSRIYINLMLLLIIFYLHFHFSGESLPVSQPFFSQCMTYTFFSLLPVAGSGVGGGGGYGWRHHLLVPILYLTLSYG